MEAVSKIFGRKLMKERLSNFYSLEKIPDLKQASLSPRGNFIQIESSWSVTDPAKLDASSLSKTWLFDTKSACVIPLQSRTHASPTTVVKKTTTTKSGLFAQIVEIEVGKNKELFIERWDQDRRLNRIPLAKTVESVPKDADLTGGAVLSDDGRHCVFAAELKVCIGLRPVNGINVNFLVG